MTPEEAIHIADKALLEKTDKYLTDIQRMILRESLDSKGYEEMQGYSPQHIKNEGRELWKLLSQALGEKVSKTNFKGALERHFQADDNLSSKKFEKDYLTKLRNFLAAKAWRDADQETLHVMRKLAMKDESSHLSITSILQLPCEDLKAIDLLWLKFSYGKFGISVQKQKWAESGGKLDYGVDRDAAWKAYKRASYGLEWGTPRDWILRERTYSLEGGVRGHLPSWFDLNEINTSFFDERIMTEEMEAQILNGTGTVVFSRASSPFGGYAQALDCFYTRISTCAF